MAFKGLKAEGELYPFATNAEYPHNEIVWSMQAGKIKSAQANALITALTVEACCGDSVQQMRGLRIELHDDNKATTLYLEEKDIKPILRVVLGLDQGIEAGNVPVLIPGQQSSCHGMGEFWNPKPPFHRFMIDYCAMTGWLGLSIQVHSPLHRFNFPNHRPAEFARILDHGLNLLKASQAEYR